MRELITLSREHLYGGSAPDERQGAPVMEMKLHEYDDQLQATLILGQVKAHLYHSELEEGSTEHLLAVSRLVVSIIETIEKGKATGYATFSEQWMDEYGTSHVIALFFERVGPDGFPAL